MSKLIMAYDEGAEAYTEGVTIGHCPYLAISPEGEAWIEGYQEQRALRLNEMSDEEIYDRGYQAGFIAAKKGLDFTNE